jgi:ribosomal protein L29
MALLRRIRRLEAKHGLEDTLEAELRNMSDEELDARIEEIEDVLGVEKRWDEMTPQEQDEYLVDLRRQLMEEGSTVGR